MSTFEDRAKQFAQETYRTKIKEFYSKIYQYLIRHRRHFLQDQLASAREFSLNDTPTARYRRLKNWIVFCSPNGQSYKLFKRYTYQHAKFVYQQQMISKYGGFAWYPVGTLGSIMRAIPDVSDGVNFDRWLKATMKIEQSCEIIKLKRLEYYCSKLGPSCSYGQNNKDENLPCLCRYFSDKNLENVD
jgi:hypothetical protein